MSERAVLVESNSSIPIVHFSVSCRNGALEDPIGKEGATRLLTRLMRRTAGGRTADEVDSELDRLGATLGAEVSGSTVALSGTVIARNLDACMALVGDVMARATLDADELERLKRETKAELVESLDNDRSLARRWFRRTFFAGHPYGRSVIGSPTSIDAITGADLEALKKRMWVGENLVFSFAGDITSEAANATSDKLAAPLPAGAALVDDTPEPKPLAGRHLLFVDKPERTQTQILIGTRGTSVHDEDHTALVVANTVFGGTFTARLCQEVRAKRGWSYGAYSHLPFDRRRHAFTMWTFPKASDAAACIQLELDLLEQWVRSGITADELAWSKAYMINSNAFSVDTAAKRAGQTLDEVIYGLPAGYFDGYVERVRSVTLEEVNAAVQRRISSADLLVTVVGTEQDIGADVRDATSGLQDAATVKFDAE